jgi:hypothetical protein
MVKDGINLTTPLVVSGYCPPAATYFPPLQAGQQSRKPIDMISEQFKAFEENRNRHWPQSNLTWKPDQSK